jgi:hypothetical protein
MHGIIFGIFLRCQLGCGYHVEKVSRRSQRAVSYFLVSVRLHRMAFPHWCWACGRFYDQDNRWARCPAPFQPSTRTIFIRSASGQSLPKRLMSCTSISRKITSLLASNTRGTPSSQRQISRFATMPAALARSPLKSGSILPLTSQNYDNVGRMTTVKGSIKSSAMRTNALLMVSVVFFEER